MREADTLAMIHKYNRRAFLPYQLEDYDGLLCVWGEL